MAKHSTSGITGTLPVETPPSDPTLHWQSASRSELGFVRTVNEDALLDHSEQSLWVVADGMGGHSFGDEASRAIIDQLADFTYDQGMHNNIEDLQQRIINAHELCRSNRKGQLMGSTVVALYAHNPYCFFLWAGDSRIYRFRQNQLDQMTEDHSLVQELVSIGELQREEMHDHPSSNIITKAVGSQSEFELEIRYALVEPGDRYLICSDGLFKDVTDAEIAERMAKATINECLDQLVDLALERGGTDNTTAIVAQAN